MSFTTAGTQNVTWNGVANKLCHHKLTCTVSTICGFPNVCTISTGAWLMYDNNNNNHHRQS